VNLVSRHRDRIGVSERANPARGPFALLGLSLLVVMAAFLPTRSNADDRSLILATTTSVRDSGLFDALLPGFTEQSGIEVRVIAVGTGAALRMGREGNADILLTHAPTAEQELVDEGVVTRRTPFMQNFFVIAGPAEDPADVAGAASPIDAIRRIATSQSNWVSRADDSGTHKREMNLFEAAGVAADADWKGFDRTGSGMGLSLQVAGEHRAYILSDIGTFLAFQKRIDLIALSKPADSLQNIYSVLQLDSKRFKRPIASAAAEAFERFLIDSTTQNLIAGYGNERFGRALFTPLHPDDETITETNEAVQED
jgi:tungstate transport system substrate-binding protein